MIEAMVAVLIVGFGLLGMAGMQSRALVVNQSAYYRSIAADLGRDLSERIRALRTPFMANNDATLKPARQPDFSKCTYSAGHQPNCVAQDPDRATYQAVVNSEMTEWNTALTSQLPSGAYTLTPAVGSNPDFFRYTLTITWLDDRQNNASYSMVIE